MRRDTPEYHDHIRDMQKHEWRPRSTNRPMESDMTSLTAREALQIAAYYGFSVGDAWEKSLIRDSIIQAREAEGYRRPDGSFKSARSYFDGYMADTAAEHRADSLAARDFQRNAYGE
jgi:hypothetical protein